MEQRAKQFATQAHASIDQRRKYSGELYIVHPAAVVEIVRSVDHTEAMLAAAWLHDTVEDTPVTLEDIKREFGDEVAELVEMLTDVSRPEDGNRAVRKEIDRQHTARASRAAKTIKLADLIENSCSILAHDRGFARTYLREKARLLEVLQEGDSALLQQATEIAIEGLSQLGLNGEASALAQWAKGICA
jgi:(p)ppGpp synthase/HD superfamily hydrolase